MSKTQQTTLWPTGWHDAHFACMQAELARTPLATKGQHETALAHYRERLRAAQQHNEFLDVRLAELLIAALCQLWPVPSADDALSDTWLQMAVAYLVHTDDAKDDEAAIDGLDDDADVVLALLDALDRADLAKPIREHLRR